MESKHSDVLVVSEEAINKKLPDCFHEANGISFNVDQILEDVVKPFGFWQWSLALLLTFSCTSTMTFPVYANSASPHRCRMEELVEQFILNNNISFEQAATVVGPWGQNVEDNQTTVTHKGSGCLRYKLDWENTNIEQFFFKQEYLNSSHPTEHCKYGYVYETSPYYYPGNVVAEFSTVCDYAWLVPFGTSVYMVGVALGNIFGGWSGGRFGRKNTLILSACIEAVCGIWISLSPNYVSYILARSAVGIGSTAKANVAGVLLLELTLAKYRSTFRAILSLGIAFIYRGLMALWAYYLPYWRWLNVAVMSPCLFSLLYFFFLPESPRWLFSKRRYSKGMDVLKAGYRINHIRKPKSQWHQLERLAHEAVRIELTDNDEDKSSSRRHSPKCSLCIPLSNPLLIKTTLLTTTIMFGVSMCFVGMIFYARAVRHYIYVVGFLNALMAVPGLILFTILYRLIRHRKLPLMALVGIILLVLAFGSVYTIFCEPTSDIVLIVCSNIAVCLLQASINMVVLYVPELFPSDIRTQGLGLVLAMSKGGGIICSFVNSLDQHVLHGLPLLIYASVLIVVLGALVLLRDTSGENLPDN
ncbi:Organic cation transporter protein [Paragonimus heterotremus]|uniref:Organic cation transporter protein n=1 Tax=Paragonimus heterotremus TaxID=100268 RepID=A0A8J4X1M9_9TREM|nr:Organic cation transporter protein [Paragonimus heterotremus]